MKAAWERLALAMNAKEVCITTNGPRCPTSPPQRNCDDELLKAVRALLAAGGWKIGVQEQRKRK